MNLKSIIGYTDTETVKLDFDNTPFKEVKYWALRTMKWFKLEGFIILESSENNYHVVFDRTVSWEENVKIMAWVSLCTKHQKLTGWFILQCIKKGSTLRVSLKRDKPSPKLVYRYGRQDNEIKHFLIHRKLIKNITRKLRGRAGSLPLDVQHSRMQLSSPELSQELSKITPAPCHDARANAF